MVGREHGGAARHLAWWTLGLALGCGGNSVHRSLGSEPPPPAASPPCDTYADFASPVPAGSGADYVSLERSGATSCEGASVLCVAPSDFADYRCDSARAPADGGPPLLVEHCVNAYYLCGAILGCCEDV